MRFLSPFLSFLLTPLLVVSPLYAQLPVAMPGSAAAELTAPDLQLRLLATEGFQAPAESRSQKGFAVLVTNASGQPVANAAVVFRMPDTGATGTFGDGTHAAVAYTDEAGVARFQGIQWGSTEGLVAVRVTASKGSSHAGMLLEHSLTQSLASAKPRSNSGTNPASLAPPAISVPEETAETLAYIPAKPVPPPLSPGLPARKNVEASAITPAPRVSVTSASNPAVHEPSVSVTTASPDTKIHGSSKGKWIAVAAIAAGAGIGLAMAMGKGKASTSGAAASTVSIGAPTISIGTP